MEACTHELVIKVKSTGQLLCCGSPLYLKSRFGPGYYLNIEKDSGEKASDTVNSKFKNLIVLGVGD